MPVVGIAISTVEPLHFTDEGLAYILLMSVGRHCISAAEPLNSVDRVLAYFYCIVVILLAL